VTPERAKAHRKQVSALIEAVLAEEISARTALNCWPTFCNEDPSVACAYTMLWFFEADEDRHHQEMFYSDLQLKTLKEASGFLRKGEALPLSLLEAYQGVVAPPEYSGKWTWLTPLRWLHHQLNMVLSILKTSPWLQGNQPPKRTLH
jgi:hypothetical protein